MYCLVSSIYYLRLSHTPGGSQRPLEASGWAPAHSRCPEAASGGHLETKGGNSSLQKSGFAQKHHFLKQFASKVVSWLEVCVSSSNFTTCFCRWHYKKQCFCQLGDAAEPAGRARARSITLIISKSEPWMLHAFGKYARVNKVIVSVARCSKYQLHGKHTAQC